MQKIKPITERCVSVAHLMQPELKKEPYWQLRRMVNAWAEALALDENSPQRDQIAQELAAKAAKALLDGFELSCWTNGGEYEVVA